MKQSIRIAFIVPRRGSYKAIEILRERCKDFYFLKSILGMLNAEYNLASPIFSFAL